jgi:hypothetical protein
MADAALKYSDSNVAYGSLHMASQIQKVRIFLRLEARGVPT